MTRPHMLSMTIATALAVALLSGCAGPTGLTGPAGPEGATGQQGPAGAPGPTGATGPAGPVGATGPTGSTGATGATGAAGPQGIPGLNGIPGVVGPSGPQGIQGIEGPAGPQGLRGIAGPQGPQGDIGPAGPAGQDATLIALVLQEEPVGFATVPQSGEWLVTANVAWNLLDPNRVLSGTIDLKCVVTGETSTSPDPVFFTVVDGVEALNTSFGTATVMGLVPLSADENIGIGCQGDDSQVTVVSAVLAAQLVPDDNWSIDGQQ